MSEVLPAEALQAETFLEEAAVEQGYLSRLQQGVQEFVGEHRWASNAVAVFAGGAALFGAGAELGTANASPTADTATSAKIATAGQTEKAILYDMSHKPVRHGLSEWLKDFNHMYKVSITGRGDEASLKGLKSQKVSTVELYDDMAAKGLLRYRETNAHGHIVSKQGVIVKTSYKNDLEGFGTAAADAAGRKRPNLSYSYGSAKSVSVSRPKNPEQTLWTKVKTKFAFLKRGSVKEIVQNGSGRVTNIKTYKKSN